MVIIGLLDRLTVIVKLRNWLVLKYFSQAFGQSFLQPDIHIFKQNLSYLESLNSKHKLYHRVGWAFMTVCLFLKVLQVREQRCSVTIKFCISLTLFQQCADCPQGAIVQSLSNQLYICQPTLFIERGMCTNVNMSVWLHSCYNSCKVKQPF